MDYFCPACAVKGDYRVMIEIDGVYECVICEYILPKRTIRIPQGSVNDNE